MKHTTRIANLCATLFALGLLQIALVGCMAQGPSQGSGLQRQTSNRIETLLRTQRSDGSWSRDADRTYTTALCSLALLSQLECMENSEQEGAALRQGLAKALHHLLLSSPTERSSAAAYVRAIALYHGWEFLGKDDLQVAANAALHSLAAPADTHAQLAEVMLLLSSASLEYRNSHGRALNKQEVISTFHFLDRTLPPSQDAVFRLHLRTVIFWSGVRDRPLGAFLPEFWAAVTPNADEPQETSVRIQGDAFLVLTDTIFRFRKVGPGAGLYGYSAYDAQPAPPAIEESSPVPEIRIGP